MNKKTDICQQLEKQIKELQDGNEGLKSKYLRALADYQNLEKRVISQREETAKYAAEKIIKELLAVLDTLKKADQHLNDSGLRLGVGDFLRVLIENGVKKIEVLHKKFDPNFMECVEIVENDKEDEVIEEIRAGYTLWDKIIRVAQVKVGKKKTQVKN
ncbi:nucleotide exchange factor GrpE [Candidatus Microgenomates bacterium]|nr:nucleotide exchange factor GrpE [Candidatus Microgenomates bacterium]